MTYVFTNEDLKKADSIIEKFDCQDSAFAVFLGCTITKGREGISVRAVGSKIRHSLNSTSDAVELCAALYLPPSVVTATRGEEA